MQPELQDLMISAQEIERLSGLDVGVVFAGGTVRKGVLSNPRKLTEWAIAQLMALGIILIFCFPLGLVVGRSFGWLSNDPASLARFVQGTLGVSGAIALGWNGYLWRRHRQLGLFLTLLDEVDKHHEILRALQILDELETVQAKGDRGDRAEVLAALAVTRESLVCALLTEKILRQHQAFLARRQELLEHVETNLGRLRSLRMLGEADEYGRLMREALDIGLSVHRELHRLDA